LTSNLGVDPKGASVLITGSSSGIGRACAIAFAQAGADVVATARQPEAVADLQSLGIRPLRLDVRRDEEVTAAVEAAKRVDVLVANAGYGIEGAVEEISDDDLIEQYDTNVFGVWRCCRAVLPQMRKRGDGTIVIVSSFGGQAPFPGIGAYRSSKFAVEGLAWTLHLEVAHFGIRVIDVQPGLVASDFGSRSIRKGSRVIAGDPYSEMRRIAADTYPRMSPTALSPDDVAAGILAEVRRDHGPLRLRVGEDAQRMVASIEAGDDEYQRYLVDELGFTWHPLSEHV
jgi:NAD(P)-dependent dehydrogenase (short-subunit alcohol dehydrogenase family)